MNYFTNSKNNLVAEMPKDSKVISAAYGRSERFRTLKKLSKVGFRNSVELEQ